MERQIEWVETRNRLGSRKNVGSCFLWTRRVVSELVFSFPWIPLQVRDRCGVRVCVASFMYRQCACPRLCPCHVRVCLIVVVFSSG
ncbi:hypothetical protein M6B38_258530 [Iris pallida]|uniref:Uncharacterized protein n=1 Tax=Iris pallida TaxID=29817 RepID=A0AAX6DNF0_IRIPA|nr:hypothetical protein M6B38_111215 [Iris pallida]KAJ6851736.1 hypothetical protein M6B38_258530 [Iris pallida]